MKTFKKRKKKVFIYIYIFFKFDFLKKAHENISSQKDLFSSYREVPKNLQIAKNSNLAHSYNTSANNSLKMLPPINSPKLNLASGLNTAKAPSNIKNINLFTFQNDSYGIFFLGGFA